MTSTVPSTRSLAGYRPKLLNHSLTYSLVQQTGTPAVGIGYGRNVERADAFADAYEAELRARPRLTVSTIASSMAVISFRATRLLVVVAALLLGPLGAAATAHADTNDSIFLAALKSEGITDHLSAAHAVEAAHTVCQKLDDGLMPTEVANDVLNSSTMPAYHSGYFVGASIDAYCPQYKSKISGNS